MSDAGADQRERRRQQLQKKRSGPSVDPAKLRRLIPWAFVLLIAGAVIGGMVYTASQGDRCPGHWHSGFTVFVDDQRVPFTEPRFFNQQNDFASGSHVHADDGVFHFHPATSRCIPTENVLRFLGVDVTLDRLILEEFHGFFAGTHEANATHELKVFYKELHGEWEELTNLRSFKRDQLPDGSAFMITYGELTEERIQSQLARATTLEGGSYDPSRFR